MREKVRLVTERLHIGFLHLTSNLFLAPLAGYTNLPFRLCLREVGGFGLASTELIHARSFIERQHKALVLARKQLASMGRLEKSARARRLWGVLGRRGFDEDTVREVLEKLGLAED